MMTCKPTVQSVALAQTEEKRSSGCTDPVGTHYTTGKTESQQSIGARQLENEARPSLSIFDMKMQSFVQAGVELISL